MDKQFTAGILTISDKGSAGKRKDESGDIIARMLGEYGFLVPRKKIIPDNRQEIEDTLIDWVDSEGFSFIVTTGGTGLSPTDVTPQAMEKVIDYEVPGMAEAMRAASLKKTPHAMISRAMAGVRKNSLIINLPGSPGGARDNLSVVFPALNHALLKLSGDTSNCAIQSVKNPLPV